MLRLVSLAQQIKHFSPERSRRATILKSQKGFAPLIPIFILTLFSVAFFATILKNQTIDLSDYSPLTAIKISPIPSLSPTPSSSPTPSPATQAKATTPAVTQSPKAPAAAPTSNTPPGSGYAYMNVSTDKGAFKAHVVVLQNPTMITDTANDSDCSNDCPTKPLADYINHFGGFAGINGSYFCPADYGDCASKKNSFDFSVYNTRLSKWINSGNLGWGGRSVIYKDGGGFGYRQNASDVPGGISAAVVNYPGILNAGNITVEDSGLSDKQRVAGTKGGIGLNGNTVYLVIAQNVTMYEFAQVFKAIGVTHALNLDGGGSSALYFGGYKVGPGRSLPNAVIFK